MSNAGYYNMTIEKDRTFSKRIQVFDNSTGSAQDLTGYLVRMQVRPYAGSPTLLLELSTTIGNITIIPPATQGIITLDLSAATTAALTFDKGDYDLIFKSPLGVVTEIIQGLVTVLPRVTLST